MVVGIDSSGAMPNLEHQAADQISDASEVLKSSQEYLLNHWSLSRMKYIKFKDLPSDVDIMDNEIFSKNLETSQKSGLEAFFPAPLTPVNLVLNIHHVLPIWTSH